LENSANAAKPFQTVRIQGTHRCGADTPFECSAWKEVSGWPFRYPPRPISRASSPPLGSRGLYQLRMLDPDSDLTSKPSVLVIEG
jgi:hypothetical protein